MSSESLLHLFSFMIKGFINLRPKRSNKDNIKDKIALQYIRFYHRRHQSHNL